MNKIDSFHVGAKLLIFSPEKKLLLLKKQTYWDLPGGRIHQGESVQKALLREVKEETGLQELIGINPFLTVMTDIRIPNGNDDVGLIFSIFCANLLNEFKPILSDEHEHYEWLTVSEAAKLLKPQYPSEFISKLIAL